MNKALLCKPLVGKADYTHTHTHARTRAHTHYAWRESAVFELWNKLPSFLRILIKEMDRFKEFTTAHSFDECFVRNIATAFVFHTNISSRL